MKKLAISVLLLLLCGDTMGSDWRTFGSKPEEKEFLTGIEEQVRWYFEPEQLDSDMDDLATCVADTIFLYKDGFHELGHTHPPLFMPPEIIDEFLDELLDNTDELERNCCNPELDDQAREKLVKEWSAHKLLEKWKQEREANGGRRVEKPVPDGYIKLKQNWRYPSPD